MSKLEGVFEWYLLKTIYYIEVLIHVIFFVQEFVYIYTFNH